MKSTFVSCANCKCEIVICSNTLSLLNDGIDILLRCKQCNNTLCSDCYFDRIKRGKHCVCNRCNSHQSLHRY